MEIQSKDYSTKIIKYNYLLFAKFDPTKLTTSKFFLENTKFQSLKNCTHTVFRKNIEEKRLHEFKADRFVTQFNHVSHILGTYN